MENLQELSPEESIAVEQIQREEEARYMLARKITDAVHEQFGGPLTPELCTGSA